MSCSKIAHVAFLFAAAALMGCASIAPSPSVPAAPDLCRAEEYRGMIGTPIAAATFPSGVRTIGPDTIITEDQFQVVSSYYGGVAKLGVGLSHLPEGRSADHRANDAGHGRIHRRP